MITTTGSLEEIMSQLLLLVLAALAAGLLRLFKIGLDKGIAYMEANMGKSQLDMVYTYAGAVVNALEQTDTLTKLDAKGKKEQAIAQIASYALKLGIVLDKKEMDNIIESAVLKMKTAISEKLPAKK